MAEQTCPRCQHTWGEPEIGPDRVPIEWHLPREDMLFLRKCYDMTIADDESIQFPSGWWLTGEELRRRRCRRYRWLAWKEDPCSRD